MDIKTLSDKIQNLYDQSSYADAKNLGDWYFGEFPDVFNIKTAPDAYLTVANSARCLSDYLGAIEMYKNYQEAYPEDEQIGLFIQECESSMQAKKLEFEAKDAIEIVLHDMRYEQNSQKNLSIDKLYDMVHRLHFVFDRIAGQIHIALASDEADYLKIYSTAFPGAAVVKQYEEFQSSGFSLSTWGRFPHGFHLLVFKEIMENMGKEFALWDYQDLAIFGMCAHEMSHFDVPEGIYQNNTNPNERETDLHVLSKGFAYSLYISRRDLGAEYGVMNPDEIKSYILDIENK